MKWNALEEKMQKTMINKKYLLKESHFVFCFESLNTKHINRET